MSKSTITLANDIERTAMLTLLLKKISVINRAILEETGLQDQDEAKQVKKILFIATRFKKFLSHKDSVVTLTIDDLDEINSVIEYEVKIKGILYG